MGLWKAIETDILATAYETVNEEVVNDLTLVPHLSGHLVLHTVHVL